MNLLLLAFGYLPSVVTFEVFIKATAGQIDGLNLLDVEAEIRNGNVFSSLASPDEKPLILLMSPFLLFRGYAMFVHCFPNLSHETLLELRGASIFYLFTSYTLGINGGNTTFL